MCRRYVEAWKARARKLKTEAYALYLAYRDPRVPWYVKAFVACVVGYAFSPIDLIPDFVPILGYVDDLVLVPLGIALAVKMIPPGVLAECRQAAQTAMEEGRLTNRAAAGAIVVIWILVASILAVCVWHWVR